MPSWGYTVATVYTLEESAREPKVTENLTAYHQTVSVTPACSTFKIPKRKYGVLSGTEWNEDYASRNASRERATAGGLSNPHVPGRQDDRTTTQQNKNGAVDCFTAPFLLTGSHLRNKSAEHRTAPTANTETPPERLACGPPLLPGQPQVAGVVVHSPYGPARQAHDGHIAW